MYLNTSSPKLLYVRRMGNSLHVTLPADVVREFALDTGYAALMSVVPHGIKVKFMNAAELSAMTGDDGDRPVSTPATRPQIGCGDCLGIVGAEKSRSARAARMAKWA
jgi:hypothetical protein